MGLAAATVAILATTAAAVGVARLLSVSLEARSDLRSALAPAAGRPGWTRPMVDRTAQLAIIASVTPPAVQRTAPDPPVALALTAPETSSPQSGPADDPEVTGSVGADTANPAPSGMAADGRAANAVVRLDPPPPRRGPRLAALSPLDGLGDRRDVDLRRSAIYDIAAHTVHLPSGERLEAHSGVGRLMDDPRSVHRKNVGATPPNIYKLSLRESLFHGVRAIRLTPANEREMFGRDGMLAHSYLLGPSGQSHGCVAFKDYPKFLRAFLRGDIDRMIVVRRLDKPPTFFARRDVRGASTTF